MKNTPPLDEIGDGLLLVIILVEELLLLVGQRHDGQIGHEFAVVRDLKAVAFDDFADGYAVEVPFVEDLDDFLFTARAGDDQHSLLRFGEEHFVGGHAGLALRDES